MSFITTKFHEILLIGFRGVALTRKTGLMDWLTDRLTDWPDWQTDWLTDGSKTLHPPQLVAWGIITCKKQQHVHDRTPPDSGKTVQPYSFNCYKPLVYLTRCNRKGLYLCQMQQKCWKFYSIYATHMCLRHRYNSISISNKTNWLYMYIEHVT